MQHLDRYLKKVPSRTLSLSSRGELDVPKNIYWSAKVLTAGGTPLAQAYGPTPAQALENLDLRLDGEP